VSMSTVRCGRLLDQMLTISRSRRTPFSVGSLRLRCLASQGDHGPYDDTLIATYRNSRKQPWSPACS
jgi:hypothetical protein